MASVDLADLVQYLDAYLRVADMPDAANAVNGLQVENAGSIGRVLAAVDACQATIDAAAAREQTLLLVHHGLFWSGLEPIRGRHGRRIRALIRGDVALYAAHLPLDVHPEVGNNAVLAARLGIAEPEPFGAYQGIPIGVAGRLAMGRDELVDRLHQVLGADPFLIPAGPQRVHRVGVVTGGAGGMIGQARDAGLDTFITGEGAHHTYFDAEEWGLNVIYAGHYATETVGVQALSAHLETRFGLPWAFVDHPTGL